MVMSSKARYMLIDGDQMAREHPKTWGQPTMEDRLKLQVGHFVKIGFEFHMDGGERIWFKITGIHGEGEARTYSGQLANDPVDRRIPKDLTFENRHIIALE